MFIAERQGFEPWVPARAQRFSRPPRSTTPASFPGRISRYCGFAGAKLSIIFDILSAWRLFFEISAMVILPCGLKSEC